MSNTRPVLKFLSSMSFLIHLDLGLFMVTGSLPSEQTCMDALCSNIVLWKPPLVVDLLTFGSTELLCDRFASEKPSSSSTATPASAQKKAEETPSGPDKSVPVVTAELKLLERLLVGIRSPATESKLLAEGDSVHAFFALVL